MWVSAGCVLGLGAGAGAVLVHSTGMMHQVLMRMRVGSSTSGHEATLAIARVFQGCISVRLNTKP